MQKLKIKTENTSKSKVVKYIIAYLFMRALRPTNGLGIMDGGTANILY